MSNTRTYKYYDLMMAAFVAVILSVNLVAQSKPTTIMGYTFGAGVLFFPISYLFGDILTEVYGYARARRVVWSGFAAMIFATFVTWFVLKLPPAAGWPHQEAFKTVFSSTSQIVLASLVGFCCGEFSNSYVLAKMKVLTQGRFLWLRTIGSTVVGEAVDSIIFYPLAFYGIWPNELIVKVMISNYVLKVLWEVAMTPVTYKIVGFLKKAEHEDFFDRATNFTPFSLKT